ncbi:MAG: DUF302 domain-containing protein [Bacteroidales bacterium]|nr:DUF302 domain-containing protein [Bacteroidales bacterium]
MLFIFSSCSQPEPKEEENQIQISQAEEPMFLENESMYGFSETLEKLNAEIEKTTWKAVTVHNLQESVKKSGTDVLPIQVFVLCQPNHAAKILLKDEERMYSSLLPCRVSVYEKSDGLTYISRMNTGVLAKSIGGISEEVMMVATKEIEEIISPLFVTK